jgi:peptidoglycan/xylan/chitin deacetylase (PgdA/CDA1 family)
VPIRRYLLYGGYTFLKKVGYLNVKNRIFRYANIVTFHRVNDYDKSPLTTSVNVFERMMWEIRKRYLPIPLEMLVDSLTHGKETKPGTVVITFDDGYEDNFLNAAPILKKYQLPATFFVTSGYINSNKVFPWDKESSVKHSMMNWDQVRELCRSGFEIGAHTHAHVDLEKVPLNIAREEIKGSRDQIERAIGKNIKAFSTPFGYKGSIRQEIIEIVKEAGFECCCSAHGGKVTRHSDLFNLNRVSMYPNVIEMKMELDNFMTYFDGRMRINMLGCKH